MSATEETVIWKGHPSHALNFWLHFFSWLLCPLIVPIFISLWKIWETRCNEIEITTERLRTTIGIFSKRKDDLELYRVRDTTFVQPFFLRLFNRGSLVLTTSDASTPTLTLPGIPADEELRNRLRIAIEACRDRKRARVAELGGVIDTSDDHPQV